MVHPRERGEHPVRVGQTALAVGSSPRARGTHPIKTRRLDPLRFIPASAGNTSASSSTEIKPTVHPRERGEHISHLAVATASAGSSPRARGTLGNHGKIDSFRRFIPASAGNTVSWDHPERQQSVHPRERGEHSQNRLIHAEELGSSPRARGTPAVHHPDNRRVRFIPASAGNTCNDAGHDLRDAVHPRERGEHSEALGSANVQAGSSPRARGTREVGRADEGLRRFIPASAGNTARPDGVISLFSVHPRERGEHAAVDHSDDLGSGSSPRARGTPLKFALLTAILRFIPASAGNTLPAFRRSGSGPVHPRERGEHPSWKRASTTGSGSSPRARGTHDRCWLDLR